MEPFAPPDTALKSRAPFATDEATWLAPATAIAAVVLGHALQVNNGNFAPDAILWLTVTLTLVVGAVAVRRSRRFLSLDTTVLPWLCSAGLLVQAAQLYTAPPGYDLRQSDTLLTMFRWGPIALAALGLWLVWGPRRRVPWLVIALFLALHAAMGTTVLRDSTKNVIDVDVFHRQSIAALRAGENPYTLTFPDIYSHPEFYGRGMSVANRLQFGFPYPPTTLLMSMPGTLLFREHRYAALVAVELTALLMLLMQPRGFGLFAALIYLTSPRIFYLLQMSWTEPFVVLGLAAVAWAANRHQRLVPWLFGLFLGMKQYMVLAVPAAWLLWSVSGSADASRDWRGAARWLATAAIIPAVVTLPFVLWNLDAFMHSVVMLQFYQPFRSDSLSLLAWWTSLGHLPPSSAIPFGVAAIASALAVWRCPRTAAGFSAAIAITFLGFFAFNKQAFCNYYFLVIGALCVTLAAYTPREPSRH